MKQASLFGLTFLLFTSAITIVGGKLSNTYSNSEHKYQISYPKGWKVDESKGKENILLTAPIIDTITKQPEGSITIDATVNTKITPTTEIYKASMNNLQSTTKDFKIVEEGEMFLGEVKSKYVIHHSKSGTSTITTVQFYFSNGKTSFILGGTVPGETLGKNKDLYFDIAKSIKFSKK